MVYKGITSFRNFLFDKGILIQFSPDVFSIGVGNLTVGGTGKTPLTDYLIHFFKEKKVAVISRGYGRKTAGFIEVTTQSTASEVGDEPLMLFHKNPGTAVFVSEKRVEGYHKALGFHPDVDCFIFDDVFQHRYLKPHINLLLCDFNRPFFEDKVLPWGRLRESRYGTMRADAVIVTKTPENFKNKSQFIEKIRKYARKDVPIFFAQYKPEVPVNFDGIKLKKGMEIVLLSAIAQNNIFYEQSANEFQIKEHFAFRDHYSIKRDDLLAVFNRYPGIPILTTEKDMVKIKDLISRVELENFFVSKLTVILQDSFRKYLLSHPKFP